jgi:FtsP/CotA-like multicopper oxidase with cupredoxin domain
MAEADEVKPQHVDPNNVAPAANKDKIRAARRKFLRQALAFTSGIALAEFLPSAMLKAAPMQVDCTPGSPLVPIGEIKSNGNRLQAVIKIIDLELSVPTSTTTVEKLRLRNYTGYNPADPSQSWPKPQAASAPPPPPGPGPTLRCSIGDEVQIMFLNQVNTSQFPASLEQDCDKLTKGSNTNFYPATDKFPNCLHASSAANIHFHGTHVTPATTGDNVLVTIWPNKDVTEREVEVAFKQIFQECETRKIPQKWEDLPAAYRSYQEQKIKKLDATAPYVGPGANPNGRGVPPNLALWPKNEEAIKQGVWPQYHFGSYPYCYKIPKYEGPTRGVKMGQSPGTHWYHSHKHGSTAINLFDGLSGAFIIEDNSPTGYDGALKAFYDRTGSKLDQVVMVIQQIAAEPNLLTPQGGQVQLLVNGQFTPTIEMRPGQVQLWRMINSTVRVFFSAGFLPCTGTAAIQYMQTAQDGVQFSPTNYKNQPLTKTRTGGSLPLNHMSPANRIDLLVKAPNTTGLHVLKDTNSGDPLLYVNVAGSAQPMDFPSESQFPALPEFLNDIDPSTIRLRREITYGWDRGTNVPSRDRSGAAPQYNIDGKQFQDNEINQVMLLDTAEEWTISNKTMAITHPFHIHVNPFQIVEIFEPAKGDTAPRKLSPPYVWWDVFGIPAGAPDPFDPETDPLKKRIIPGYFKMRSRFVDFTGQYVQHCHILAHEDRGMMQLLEVVNNRTVTKHH